MIIKHILRPAALLLMLVGFVVAQDTGTIYGNVSAEDGAPLIGANIIVVGTGDGGTSDNNGFYEIKVAPGTYSVRAEYIGFASNTVDNITVAAGQTSQADFTMTTATLSGEEVVVTALGIQQKTKALGFSLTEVKGEELSLIKEPNAIEALQGKVAGVNVTTNATGGAGTSRVIIRGNSSLTGDNQPLYVVDGIPIGNRNEGSAGMWGGADGGDGISSINADDVESVSVLKGGAASALYGSKASNGVIIIKTKSGRGQKGLGLEYSSSTTYRSLDEGLLDYQSEYGSGRGGAKPTTQSEALDNIAYAWGAKMDGSQVIQWDGSTGPYSNHNNLKSFYRTGKTSVNTVALSNGGQVLNYRFSATNLDHDDIMPGADMNRKSFSLNANADHDGKIQAQINVKYIDEDVNGRVSMSDSPKNANYSAATFAPTVDVTTMTGVDGAGRGEDGKELRISTSPYTTNPYWAAHSYINTTRKHRFINSVSLRYNVMDWLYLKGRAGLDHFTINSQWLTPFGTAYSSAGSMGETEKRLSILDMEFIVGVDRDLMAGLSTNSFVGVTRNNVLDESLGVSGSGFVLPGINHVNNLKNKDGWFGYNEKEVGSVIGSMGLSYNSFAYVTATARKDWFSTLSFPNKKSPNNDLYTSVSTSLVLSELLSLPAAVDFAKVRFAVSTVAGGASNPYALSLSYKLWDTQHLGQIMGGINGSTIPKLDLVPLSKGETEIGLDLRLFESRLNIDLAYYSNKTTNDIVGVGTSQASGFGSASDNLGQIENKGFEFLISGTPIQTKELTWNVSLNGAKNEGTVVKTNDIDGNIGLGTPRTRNIQVIHIVGESYGLLYGQSFKRADDGSILYDVDANGIPRAQKGGYKILGEGVPPLTIGISNNIRYKNFSLGFLIDGKFGAKIFSGTNTTAYWRGLHKDTLEGRESGLKVSGTDAATGAAGSWTVSPENLRFYYSHLSEIAEQFVYDSDYLRLTNLRFGYQLPRSIVEKTPFQSASVSFIARNLFYLTKNVDNIAPEAAYNAGNAQGLEYYGLPQTKSYGFSFNVKF